MLLSGTCLDVITIDLGSLGLSLARLESEVNPKDEIYCIRSVIESVCCRSLRVLELHNVSLRHNELEMFFSCLGDRLKKVVFGNAGIRGGGWERLLRFLRERFRPDAHLKSAP